MRIPEPFTIRFRKDRDTFLFSINYTSGLPKRVCAEWQCRSFSQFPNELKQYRNASYSPTAKGGVPSVAKAAVQVLITYLKKKQSEGTARNIIAEDITVGEWIEKFTDIETSPRTGINATKNRPFSYDTLDGYEGNYRHHIKDDPLCKLRMAEVEEQDILQYITRLSVKKLKNGHQIGGTRTFEATVSFLRMAFNEYQRINRLPGNPFQYVPIAKSNRIPYTLGCGCGR